MISVVMHWAFVFFATAIADLVWADWAQAIQNKNASRASANAGLIILFGAYTTVQFVDNHWLIIPAVAGGALGTWWSVRNAA